MKTRRTTTWARAGAILLLAGIAGCRPPARPAETSATLEPAAPEISAAEIAATSLANFNPELPDGALPFQATEAFPLEAPPLGSGAGAVDPLGQAPLRPAGGLTSGAQDVNGSP